MAVNRMKLDEFRGKKHELLIGIDVGVNTGVALCDCKGKYLICVRCFKIHTAMDFIKDQYNFYGNKLKIYVEDARQRNWFGDSGREKLQGAGSIKRDSGIWEDYLKSLNVDFEMISPKRNKTKLNAEQFKQITKYLGTTNVHGRDAAMLVFGK